MHLCPPSELWIDLVKENLREFKRLNDANAEETFHSVNGFNP